MTDERYTLEEAAQVLARRGCALTGHDWQIIETAAGPTDLLCSRCGVAWRVQQTSWRVAEEFRTDDGTETLRLERGNKVVQRIEVVFPRPHTLEELGDSVEPYRASEPFVRYWWPTPSDKRQETA